MTAAMTRISVVMPVFNRAGTVDRAIESVLRQDHPDVELIVVDDGSRDDTPQRVAAYGDRLVFLRGESNRGGNWARNRGIERATGEIVSFIDSDDEFLPHKLGTVAAFFAQRPEVDVLVDSFEVRYPPARRRAPTPRHNPAIEDPETFRRAVFGRLLWKATPAISARRRALIAVGLFDETLRRRQDLDLLLRLSRAHRCVSTDAVLWAKHWTDDAISRRRRAFFLAAAIEICDRHPDYLTDPDHRQGLEYDLGRHFLRLVKAGDLGTLRRDLRRYREWGGLATSPWGLVLRRLTYRPQKLADADRARRFP